jgi:hypothetical protein
MSDILNAAITRGMVIQGSHLLVAALAPTIEHALMTMHNAPDARTAIRQEKQWRERNKKKGDPLPDRVAMWGLNDLQKALQGHWSGPREVPCFYNYFRDVLHVTSVDSLRTELEKARIARDNAAHPEFHLIEDGEAFFKAAQNVLVLLKQPEAAQRLQGYWNELSATIAGGIRNMAFLYERYPDGYEQDFEEAEELWIMGTNLRRIVGDQKVSQMKDVLRKKNGSVKILMHRPRDAVCKYAMLQEGLDQLPQYRVVVRDNLLQFFKIRADEEIGKKLEIKTIDYMLTFGLDVINGTMRNTTSAIYLRFYPLPQNVVNKIQDQPIIKFRYSDRRWYDFFLDQFTYHWEHGMAEELPIDWDPHAELNFLKLG